VAGPAGPAVAMVVVRAVVLVAYSQVPLWYLAEQLIQLQLARVGLAIIMLEEHQDVIHQLPLQDLLLHLLVVELVVVMHSILRELACREDRVVVVLVVVAGLEYQDREILVDMVAVMVVVVVGLAESDLLAKVLD
jgi:hypothetical protein